MSTTKLPISISRARVVTAAVVLGTAGALSLGLAPTANAVSAPTSQILQLTTDPVTVNKSEKDSKKEAQANDYYGCVRYGGYYMC